jgi:hypothetical protein
MASTAALDLVISLKAEGAESGLKTMASHVSALGTAVGTFAGGAALAGVRALGGAITGFLGDAIQESRDAAHGLAQTESVIKSTGGAAKVTAGQIVDMAGALSHSTLFTDDAIQADENLLLTFTNLKNGVGAGNDIFNQATKVSLDLAQAMGTDASGGAVQLGKALNDPTAGISALTRVGVTFTDQQKKQIKTLQDSGNLMGAQKIILAELNKEFGGSAEAAAKADGGFHLFNQRLSDVKQTIGDALQPALQSLMGFMAGPGLDAVESLGNSIAGGLTTAIAWLTDTGIPALVSGWNATTAAVAPALDVFSTLGSYFAAVVSDGDTFNAFLSALPGWLQPIAVIGGDVVNFLYDLGSAVGAVTAALASGDISGAFQSILGWMAPFKDDISTLASDIVTWLAPIAQTIADQVLTWGQSFIGWIPTAITNVQAALPGIWTAVSTWISDQAGPILTQMSVWGSQFIAWVPTAITDIQAALPGIWTTVSTWVGDQVQPLLTKVNEWGSQFIAWVPTAVTDLQTALPGIWTAVSTWIGDQVATITTKLGDWAGAFIDWIGPAIPGFLEAVGAFATGIGTAITTGVPIIVEKAQLWATELVAWIQRDALPKLQPAFDGFLAALSAQADRAKTVLATKGTEAGTSFSDGLKAGMAAAPIVVAGVMDATANAISAKGPAINAVALAVGKVAVDSMVNFMLSETPGRIAAWGAAAAQAILNIGPNLIAAGLVVGNNAATALYTAVTNTLNSYRGPLLALGVSIAVWVADGLKQAENLAGYAAGRIGAAILAGILAPLGSLASSVAGIVNRALGGAMAVIQSVQKIRSPSRKWADEIGKPLAQGIAQGFVDGMGKVTPAMVKQLDEATKVISAAADAVTKGTTAFPLLKSFKAPDASSIAAFTASTKAIVASLGTVAQTFKTKWLEQAGVFMDAAGKGLGIISNGVDGLNKLRTFRAPSIASVNAFTDSVLVIVQSLGTAAQIFKAEWLTHAQTFFDTAGKGLGIIGAGVDGLTKLRTFHAPSIASINAFTDTVMVIVQSLGTAAQIFKDAWLAKASAFEDTAGKGLAIIGAGVDGLTKLATFKAPSIAAINAFTDTVTLLVQSLGTVAQTFKDVWLAKAGVFADAAAKGIGIIGAAVEGFTKLSTYRGIAPAALQLFAADLQMVMDTMIGIAQNLGTKGPAAAAVFGDAVGKTIAPIGTAIDTFTKLKDYKGVARDAVILIGNDMVGVIATLGIIAQSAQGAGVAAAVAFADSAGVIFGALKTAIDALNSLAGLSKDGKAISAGLGVLAQGLADLQVVMSAIDWSASLGAWQDSFLVLFTGLMDTVFVPWQTMTRDFFSGAGFGFIGAVSEGVNSAGGGLAASAANVGGMAGASLVSSLQSNMGGVNTFVADVNHALSLITRDITVTVHTVYDGGSQGKGYGGGNPQTGWNESIGIP